MYSGPYHRYWGKSCRGIDVFISLNSYNRCPRLAAVIWFQKVSVYGSAESSYLISYPVGSFRQDGGDSVRAFPSWLKFCVMLHDFGFVVIEYKISYLESKWSFY